MTVAIQKTTFSSIPDQERALRETLNALLKAHSQRASLEDLHQISKTLRTFSSGNRSHAKALRQSAQDTRDMVVTVLANSRSRRTAIRQAAE